MSKKSHDETYSVSSSSTSQRNMSTAHDDTPIAIATKEQNRVAASKCAMVLVLLIVATGLCTATLLLFRNNEENNFERTVRTS